MGRFTLYTFLLVSLSALLAATLLVHRAPNLTAIQTSAQGTEKGGSEDIVSQIEQAVIKQSDPLEFTEGQLNRYLAHKLHGSQHGRSAWWGSFDRVLVDLEANLCQLHLCWTIAGHPTIARVDLRIERREHDFHIQILGGAYGQLQVPRGALTPLVPALRELANAADPELKALFKIPKIRLTKDKLQLDPRF